MSWVRTYWACWTWSISKKDFKLWGNTKSFVCFSSSSHSAHGFQDYDPDKGFPTAVKWDTNWKMISSGTRLNVTSAQSIAIRFWTILSVLPVTIPSFFLSLLKMSRGGNSFYHASQILIVLATYSPRLPCTLFGFWSRMSQFGQFKPPDSRNAQYLVPH